jgi:hypothetical protein
MMHDETVRTRCRHCSAVAGSGHRDKLLCTVVIDRTLFQLERTAAYLRRDVTYL